MKNKISILFFGKKSRTTSSNLLPIYLRVTIRGRRFEISTHRNVPPGKCSIEAGRMKGNTEEARSVNAYLDLLRAKVKAPWKRNIDARHYSSSSRHRYTFYWRLEQ